MTAKKATSKAAKPASHASPLERAARVKLCCFDVDGTLTDGRLWLDAEGRETKAFHVHDGQGLRLLQDYGITVALISARKSPSTVARGRELKLTHVYTAVKDKLACVRHLCQTLGITMEQVAFMGDDLADFRAMAGVGLAAAPANAHDWLKPQAHWFSPQAGGEGAARALCDLILDAQGLKEKILAGLTK